MRVGPQSRKVFAIALTLAISAATACVGENRPSVDVIEGNGSGSVSVSASGVAPAPAAGGGAGYSVVSNVDVYFAMALDLRDMRALMAPASQGQAVDWAAVTAIYEQGSNQKRSDGTARSLASIPNDAVHAIFPNGASVYGRPDFVNGIVRDGLAGTGRAQGASDDARRQMVDKGVQMLIHGKALQEVAAAKTRVDQSNTDNATGAPHAVDEGWAAVAGAPDNNLNRPYSLLQTATGREGNFELEGKLRAPLEAAYVAALKAAQQGDVAAFDQAHARIKGYQNAIFYLGTLRYVKTLEADTTSAQRQVHLAEGWTFWQAIRATVASASANAAQAIEAAYSRNPADAVPASVAAQVYAALNEEPVLRDLAIPADVVVRTPPQ